MLAVENLLTIRKSILLLLGHTGAFAKRGQAFHRTFVFDGCNCTAQASAFVSAGQEPEKQICFHFFLDIFCFTIVVLEISKERLAVQFLFLLSVKQNNEQGGSQ
jgi:hypothetical protein